MADKENAVLEAASICNKIEALGVFPVIEIGNPDRALALADALLAGGVDVLEVTLRTDSALESIRTLAAMRPDMLVGAGTVLSPEQADSAMAAGATFLVSPGYNPRVVRHCIDKGYPFYPGVGSASEIELALEAGLSVVKFFPATGLGGMATLASMAAPFKNRMRFIPLGGLSPDNLQAYARSPLVHAVGGTWIAKAGLLRDGAFSKIEANARQALHAVHGLAIDSASLPGQCGVGEPCAALDDLGCPLGAAKPGEPGELRLSCNNPARTATWLRLYKGLETTPELVTIGGREVRTFLLHGEVHGLRARLLPNTLEASCSAM